MEHLCRWSDRVRLVPESAHVASMIVERDIPGAIPVVRRHAPIWVHVERSGCWAVGDGVRLHAPEPGLVVVPPDGHLEVAESRLVCPVCVAVSRILDPLPIEADRDRKQDIPAWIRRLR